MAYISLPSPVHAPRGAVLAANAFLFAQQALGHAWRAQAAYRQQLQRGRDASALRRYAAEVAPRNPAFAADLYAAADRHFDEK